MSVYDYKWTNRNQTGHIGPGILSMKYDIIIDDGIILFLETWGNSGDKVESHGVESTNILRRSSFHATFYVIFHATFYVT